MASSEWEALNEAERTFDAINDLSALAALETAEKAYYSALASARAAWEAIPDCDAKVSGEINADDSEAESCFASADRLEWFRFALSSYQFALDCA